MAEPTDPNRIDISLSLISDQSLQAVNNLVAQMSDLREFLTSQSQPTTASRAAGMANVIARQAAITQGTGVSHGVSPLAHAPGSGAPPINPSDVAQQQNLQRQYHEYYMAMRSVGMNRSPAPPPDTFANLDPHDPRLVNYVAPRLGPFEAFMFARGEEMSGRLGDLPSSQYYDPDLSGPQSLNRDIYRYGETGIPGRGRSPFLGRIDRQLELQARRKQPAYEDRTEAELSGQNIQQPWQNQQSESGPSAPQQPSQPPGVPEEPMTIPRLGEFTIQDYLEMTRRGLGGLRGRVGSRFGRPGPTDPAVPQEGGGSGGGDNLPPAAPPSPMDDFEDEPAVFRALRQRGINPETQATFTIPRLGEFTIQDKLNMASQYLGGRAWVNREEGNAGRAVWQARLGAGAATLAENSAAYTMVQREFNRVRALSHGVEVSGEDLGYRRDEGGVGTTIGIGGIGFRIRAPFIGSEAERQGTNMRLTQTRIGLMPAVSGEEAGRIGELTRGMGYSTQDDMFDLIGRRVLGTLQQRGIDPETMAPLINQAARQGNVDLVRFRDSLTDISESARNAYMSVGDAAEATATYAEQMQNMGGGFESSVRSAGTFINAGLDPRLVSQAMQAPLVQGYGTALTGLPPQMLGTVTAAGQSQILSRSVQTALSLARGYAARGDTYMTGASGERIRVASGDDAQRAFAAQMTGLSPEVIRRFQRNPNFIQQGATATTFIDQMQRNITDMTTTHHREAIRDDHAPEIRGRYMTTRGVEHQGNVIGYRTVTGHRDLTDAERRRLERGMTNDHRVEWNEVAQELIALQPGDRRWADRVRQLSRTTNIEDRLHQARKMVGDVTRAQSGAQQQGLIGLTQEARRFFKVEKQPTARQQANAGGAPANSGAVGALPPAGGP
jgi:hypothetical protein